jgi:hypothetical protein
MRNTVYKAVKRFYNWCATHLPTSEPYDFIIALLIEDTVNFKPNHYTESQKIQFFLKENLVS